MNEIKLKETISNMMLNTEEILRGSSRIPSKEAIALLTEAERFVTFKNEESSELIDALEWLVSNYKRIVAKKSVTTVVESFSYAKSLIK